MGIWSQMANNSHYLVCPYCGERVLVHKWCANCGRKYSKKIMRTLLITHTTLTEEEIDKVLEGYEKSEDIILSSNRPIGACAAGIHFTSVVAGAIGSVVGIGAVVGAHAGSIAGTNIGMSIPNNQHKESQNETNVTTFLPSDNYSDINFVNSSIFAPLEIARNDFFILQVFIYKYNEKDIIESKAKEVDPDAVRKNFTPLDVPVKKGDKVTAHLQMSGKGLELDETDIEMIWQDHYTDCQFSVYVPEDYKPKSVVGTVTLSVNGAPAGRMTFKSKIVDAPRSLYAEIVSHKFNKIFISYSHLDEDKVKFIHQAYEALKVDHFFDRAYLKPGDVYPEKIKNYIASADLFIHCWSENAKNSDYVQLEIEDAMKRAYPGIDMDKATLAIHPLDIDPHAELPKEMNKVYNFGRM